jgi:hypothetical protein|tara:strand:- start:1259 stop:1468 length:210 start_codon:yes stop_codon:yes gene_type:complete
MNDNEEIQILQAEIEAMEADLKERKRVLQERRYTGLRVAMQARKDADQSINEELRALGVRAIRWNPLSL